MAAIKQQDWVSIGRLGAAHKLSGAIKLHVDESIGLKKLNAVLCGKTQSQALPYSIKNIKPFTNHALIIELEGVSSREQAQQLSGNTIWCNKKYVEQSEQIVSEKIIGYTIIDVQKGELSTVDDIYFLPAQTLMLFQFQNNEIMLPCHEETIIKINHTQKEVLVNIPEGLLEVYLK